MRRLEQDTPLDGVTADRPSPRHPGSRLGAITVCGARAMRGVGTRARRFALVRCSVTASGPSIQPPFSAPFRQAHQRTPQVGILTVAVMSVLPLVVAQAIAVLITGAMTVFDRADIPVMADDALDARVWLTKPCHRARCAAVPGSLWIIGA